MIQRPEIASFRTDIFIYFHSAGKIELNLRRTIPQHAIIAYDLVTRPCVRLLFSA